MRHTKCLKLRNKYYDVPRRFITPDQNSMLDKCYNNNAHPVVNTVANDIWMINVSYSAGIMLHNNCLQREYIERLVVAYFRIYFPSTCWYQYSIYLLYMNKAYLSNIVYLHMGTILLCDAFLIWPLTVISPLKFL